MFPLRDWFQAERKEHTAEWFNNITRFVRWNMKPLVSPGEAARGMEYLLGKQDMSYVRNLFLNPAKQNLNNQNLDYGIGAPVARATNHDQFLHNEMRGLGFAPLPVMEKLRNVIIAENKKMGVVVNVRANDPTSIEARKNDKALVENHKEISAFLSYIYTSIGQVPFKMEDAVARFGEKPDAGNTQDFHAMGMDSGDPSDVRFFFEMFHKLDQEINAQQVIDYIMQYNQITDKFTNWTNDLLAKKAIGAKVYVSDVNGAQIVEYIAPECIYIYGGGRRTDYNDANAKVYEQRVTVRQLLDILGNAFDIEKNWDDLLVAISYTNSVEFTAIHPSWRAWSGNNYSVDGQNDVSLRSNTGESYGYNEFMDFKVTLGYIEANSQIQNEKYDTVKEPGSFYQDNQPKEKYQSKARYETPMYCAYYLAVSRVDQRMFKFGLMPYQDIEGYNDWCSNFSILSWKEVGDPIAIQAIPLVDLINEAWYKFKYEIRRAKPRGTDYNYDSLVSIAMDLIPDTSVSKMDKVNKVIELLDSSPDGIWKFPEIDGKIVSITNNQLNIDKPNGMSDKALEWWRIVVDAWEKLHDMIGMAPLRQGDPGAPRDSMNNQFKALEYSEASTYYIPDTLTDMMQQIAVRSIFFTQDIINYRKKDALAYKFLVDAVGEDCLGKIASLGRTAMHRFGIFVESLNQAPLRAKLEAVLMEAVKTKSISTGEYFLIQGIKSTMRAAQVFAYFEQRNKKLAQKDAMQQQQQLIQGQLAIEQAKQKTEMVKGDYAIQVATIQANGGIESHLVNQIGGLSKAAMKRSADVEQIYHNANADLIRQQESLNTTGKTTPPLMMPPSQSSSPLSATPSAPPSGLQELRQNAEPAPTDQSVQ